MRKPSRKIETAPVEKVLLVQVVLSGQDKDMAEDSLLELERLSDTAGAVVVGVITQRRERPTAGFFIGEGKLVDIQLACRQAKANTIIFDNDLSAVQVNNLDLALGIKVIDRTELILQIFARRARSAEAQIQVKLAQLQYLISRMPVSVKQHRFHGGIGMRGPGESPLHLRNEPMRRQIKELKKKLDKIQQRRRMTRQGRLQAVVCIVGYTNAGKSTLLNAFSSAGAYVDDRLFATLDTKTRLVYLPDGRNILLTDTVGFIRHLPHGLVASFRSTLEVASEANLLLLVTDAGHPHFSDQLRVVKDTLAEIGAGNVPSLLLLNKCDTPQAKEHMPRLMEAYPDALPLSALQKEGLGRIKEIIAERLKSAVNSCNTNR
ncbi:MAG: GTPase HflX [Lentisphaerae bacterium RIFOXYA12_FULL_48_11]|nr:MAG: GTPase HflX [Lentisphaerae bacterium RIFOXYA12_FULL_48_11]